MLFKTFASVSIEFAKFFFRTFVELFPTQHRQNYKDFNKGRSVEGIMINLYDLQFNFNYECFK